MIVAVRDLKRAPAPANVTPGAGPALRSAGASQPPAAGGCAVNWLPSFDVILVARPSATEAEEPDDHPGDREGGQDAGPAEAVADLPRPLVQARGVGEEQCHGRGAERVEPDARPRPAVEEGVPRAREPAARARPAGGAPDRAHDPVGADGRGGRQRGEADDGRRAACRSATRMARPARFAGMDVRAQVFRSTRPCASGSLFIAIMMRS